ncbi:hypothetical protein WA158_008031 [Blastocystis sp. Blastoise]
MITLEAKIDYCIENQNKIDTFTSHKLTLTNPSIYNQNKLFNESDLLSPSLSSTFSTLQSDFIIHNIPISDYTLYNDIIKEDSSPSYIFHHKNNNEKILEYEDNRKQYSITNNIYTSPFEIENTLKGI